MAGFLCKQIEKLVEDKKLESKSLHEFKQGVFPKLESIWYGFLGLKRYVYANFLLLISSFLNLTADTWQWSLFCVLLFHLYAKGKDAAICKKMGDIIRTLPSTKGTKGKVVDSDLSSDEDEHNQWDLNWIKFGKHLFIAKNSDKDVHRLIVFLLEAVLPGQELEHLRSHLSSTTPNAKHSWMLLITKQIVFSKNEQTWWRKFCADVVSYWTGEELEGTVGFKIPSPIPHDLFTRGYMGYKLKITHPVLGLQCRIWKSRTNGLEHYQSTLGGCFRSEGSLCNNFIHDRSLAYVCTFCNGSVCVAHAGGWNEELMEYGTNTREGFQIPCIPTCSIHNKACPLSNKVDLKGWMVKDGNWKRVETHMQPTRISKHYRIK